MESTKDLETIGTGSMAGEIIESGRTLQQARAGFVTAVTVQKPRERMKVLRACEEEAAIAGDEFFYAWTVTNKDGKKSLIEGPSVNLALTAVRNWGNSGVMVNVDETHDTYIFTATFIDLETGFNLQRTFRQKKSRKIGKYDQDRAEDIIFQIGQSKAIRNVIVNAIPSWLVSSMMDKSKENIIKKIEKKGIVQARQDTIAFFERYGITVDRVETRLQKKATAWDTNDLAMLYGAIKTLTEGVESPDEIFPPLTSPPPTYDIDEKTLAELSDYFEILGINHADRSMKLASCKGNPEVIVKLKAELIEQIKAMPKKSNGVDALFGKDISIGARDTIKKNK
jgi:hypothetical protein